MGFFDFLKKPGQFPQVELYKFDEKKPEYKFDVRVDRITSEGNPKCCHDWEYVPHPLRQGRGEGWVVRYGKPVEYSNGFEYIRRMYVCQKCEAECVMLFSRFND